MNFIEKLDNWFADRKAKGLLLDMKFFPSGDPNGSDERLASATYRIVTGEIPLKPLDTSKL